MRAMVLERPHDMLRLVDRPDPEPSPGQVLVRAGTVVPHIAPLMQAAAC